MLGERLQTGRLASAIARSGALIGGLPLAFAPALGLCVSLRMVLDIVGTSALCHRHQPLRLLWLLALGCLAALFAILFLGPVGRLFIVAFAGFGLLAFGSRARSLGSFLGGGAMVSATGPASAFGAASARPGTAAAWSWTSASPARPGPTSTGARSVRWRR